MSRGKTKHWVVSDTHFSHNRLIQLGFRPEGFEDTIKKNLDEISENDILYHTGDISMYDHDFWNRYMTLMCKAKRKILIRGNHDNQTVSWYYDHGWDCVCDEFTIKMFGKNIILSHVPLSALTLALRGPNSVNIHGHIHNTNHRNADLTDNHYPVILEHEYKPVLIQKLLGL